MKYQKSTNEADEVESSICQGTILAKGNIYCDELFQ